MAGVATEDSGLGRPVEEVSSGDQLCESSDALTEWRSSEQIENGTPSTSPPYWDSDDDDDGGPKPSALYGKYTWKIDKFSQINKRELRSNAFEVGGYKWYILIYPQGCDVCNHLSLFLCVANHDKLLPGWSHFAQFTIAVVNKDPKKSKYSDTLHRFWKKEHDWGWKKFMELSKVLDGFIDSDTLIIKAQVQVIREKPDRPFRCLDCQYRRELVRVYLTNVEQICRRFVEERRGNLVKLIEDKAKWSSFRSFWLSMDPISRRRMTREKTDSILKVVVKHFFIEKEVTSTLVMDSLYSGLKALIGQSQENKGKGKYLETEELAVPVIQVEKEMFVLVNDVLLLLERAASEPLPPKDEKGPQNRTKDVSSGDELNKDSIERDEGRLTELGRRTIEIFVLAHIFNKIEVAYQHDVSLKIQEELIREEDIEQKMKRGAVDKEKKSKKKQGKQKKNNRKGKEKARDDKTDHIVLEPDSPIAEREPEIVNEKLDALEDVSDVSDSEVSVVQNGIEGINLAMVDDSSSTCSNDSIPTGNRITVIHKGNASKQKNQKATRVGTNQHKVVSEAVDKDNQEPSQTIEEAMPDAENLNEASQKSKKVEMFKKADGAHTSQDNNVNKTERHVVKEDMPTKPSISNVVDVKASANRISARVTISPPKSPSRSVINSPPNSGSKISNSSSNVKQPSSGGGLRQIDRSTTRITPENAKQVSPTPKISEIAPENAKQVSPTPKNSEIAPEKAKHVSATPKNSEIAPDNAKHVSATPKNSEVAPENAKYVSSTPKSSEIAPEIAKHVSATPKISEIAPENAKHATPKISEKPLKNQIPHTVSEKSPIQNVRVAPKTSIPPVHVMSRPVSAPLIPAHRQQPVSSVVSVVQTAPVLSRSVSATGRLAQEPTSVSTPSNYVPQSYRKAMIGTSFHQNQSPNSSYSQAPPLFLPQSSDIRPTFSPFGISNPHNRRTLWMEESRQRDGTRNLPVLSDVQNYDLYDVGLSSQFLAGTSGRRANHEPVDEFPHLDIINELLDDEQGTNPGFHSFGNGPHHHPINRHYSFPGDLGQSTSSSCRFERIRTYHPDDGFQYDYGSSSPNPYDSNWDMIHQPGPRPYMSDGSLPNQWPISGSNLLPPFSSSDSNGYHYHLPDYTNINGGVNGYTPFRPSNGL